MGLDSTSYSTKTCVDGSSDNDTVQIVRALNRTGGGVKSVNPQLAKCSYISDIYQFYGGIIYETNINGIKIHFSQTMHAISKER